jgi:hypothetical protein
LLQLVARNARKNNHQLPERKTGGEIVDSNTPALNILTVSIQLFKCQTEEILLIELIALRKFEPRKNWMNLVSNRRRDKMLLALERFHRLNLNLNELQ